MPTCKMNETKLEINENYEEADLSDVEDDVFVRSGGRNGYKLEYDIAKKPLMTPRKKMQGFDSIKNGGFHTDIRSSPPTLRIICMPMCYILIATFAMLGIVTVVSFLTSYTSWPLSVLNLLNKGPSGTHSKLQPCDNIEVEDVWVQQFPKLLTESSFRLLDVNRDGVEDVIMGYATGADGFGITGIVCDIYFKGQSPCFGGVLALDGTNGKELWRHWTEHEVFAVNCNEDLNQLGPICLISGRAGVFSAISGSDGTLIWTFADGPAKNPLMNIYTAQFIRDLNGDGVPDILGVHGGDPLAEPGSTNRLSGRIMIASGKTGEILQWVGTPDQKESYYSPQLLTTPDGTDYVLFGTGGETHAGGLYIMPLTDLYKGTTENARLLYQDDQKGIMVNPVITDINGDNVADIVMAMFNSTVVAFDGVSFRQIWNFTFPSSETYTTPTPGYFNEDSTPDFLVKYQYGPGFPIYYHAQTTVLDGVTGKPILENPIIDTIGSQASTPLIRLEGYGNDIFLYWSSNCKGHEGNSSEFGFVKGTTVHEQSRADFCKLRFNSKLINQLRAFNRVTGLPGSVIYDSELRSSTEYNNSLDTSEEGQSFLRAHPEMWQLLDPQRQVYNIKMKSQSPEQIDDIIPRYPASALLPSSTGGMNYLDQEQGQDAQSGQYVPTYPGGANIYDEPSQPEHGESVKYPTYHSVRKHGKFPVPQTEVVGGGLPSNENIIVNRRTHQFSPSQDNGKLGESGGGNKNNLWKGYYLRPQFGDVLVASDPNVRNGMDRYYTSGDQQQQPASFDVQDNADGLSNDPFPPHPQIRWKRELETNLQHRLRMKRHIGPHDMNGIQRLISTGTLAPPLNESSKGIDLIFATYWFFPAHANAILPKDQECINYKLAEEKQRFDERKQLPKSRGGPHPPLLSSEDDKRRNRTDADNSDRIPMDDARVEKTDDGLESFKVKRTRERKKLKVKEEKTKSMMMEDDDSDDFSLDSDKSGSEEFEPEDDEEDQLLKKKGENWIYRPKKDKREQLIPDEVVKDNNFWGYTSTRHINRKPEVRIPHIYPLEVATSPKIKDTLVEDNAHAVTIIPEINTFFTHTIPDPYNTVPIPEIPEEKSIKKKVEPPAENLVKMPVKSTPYTKEPPHGLRTLYAPDLAKVVAKSQSQVQQMRVDNSVNKAAKIEYEIYQDDYRPPQYRFYKQYLEEIPPDVAKEKANWIPCANCFDVSRQADDFKLERQLGALRQVKEERVQKKKEAIAKYGKGPIFNRIVSCLCGADNAAGYRVPEYEPAVLREDNEDLHHFMDAMDYKKKRKSY